nr:hypothetical protein GCM10010200_083910 [Actinomadura rugatobispora]
MEEAAEAIVSDDLGLGVGGLGERPQRACLVQGPVWAMLVEVGFVLGQDLAQVRGVEDERPIEYLVTYAADAPFHDRVHTRCLRRREHDAHAFGAEHLVEHAGEPTVAVPDQELEPADAFTQVEHEVAGVAA